MNGDVSQQLAVVQDGQHWVAQVHDGFDVFGIPHGGYLLALGAGAILRDTAAPDIFSVTCHYLRKAEVGELRFAVSPVGGSRRFTTVTATGAQGGKTVLSLMASVGDRDGIHGPSWSGVPPLAIPSDQLAPGRSEHFTPPSIAESMGLRLDGASTGFVQGRVGAEGRMRGVADSSPIDQLTALVACDLTPPAVWNALGAKGWVPTVELTAHVRARPATGPFTIDVVSNHVSDGFVEEDALVYDGTGTLVVQSRQLARWTESAG
ncbi:thioesterase family protein [Euzebya tangerina]|uniref:thioesterase family protein n=1 Tax=Euzebya tangerina TaxID=591198 RepID=UPI0013C3215C|nr:thioesterase family protein [Euzebya tangerina]